MAATSPTMEQCLNCEKEIPRSRVIFAMSDEYPKLIEDGKAEENQKLVLCYDCTQDLKD